MADQLFAWTFALTVVYNAVAFGLCVRLVRVGVIRVDGHGFSLIWRLYRALLLTVWTIFTLGRTDAITAVLLWISRALLLAIAVLYVVRLPHG